MGLYHVGRDLGNVLYQTGNKKDELAMLRQSLAIGKAAGFPDAGEIEDLLKKLGE